MLIEMLVHIAQSSGLSDPNGDGVEFDIFDDTSPQEIREYIVEAMYFGGDATSYGFDGDLFSICLPQWRWSQASAERNTDGVYEYKEVEYTEDGITIDRIDELVELLAGMLDDHDEIPVRAAIRECTSPEESSDRLESGYVVIEDLAQWGKDEYNGIYGEVGAPLAEIVTNDMWRTLGQQFMTDLDYTEVDDVNSYVIWSQ